MDRLHRALDLWMYGSVKIVVSVALLLNEPILLDTDVTRTLSKLHTFTEAKKCDLHGKIFMSADSLTVLWQTLIIYKCLISLIQWCITHCAWSLRVGELACSLMSEEWTLWSAQPSVRWPALCACVAIGQSLAILAINWIERAFNLKFLWNPALSIARPFITRTDMNNINNH